MTHETTLAHPLDWAAYLTETRELNQTEHGALLLLLAACWLQGSIPAKPRVLYRLAAATTARERRAVDRVVLQHFELSADGTYTNARLSELRAHELGRRARRSRSNSKNASRRWKPPLRRATP